MNNSCGFSTYDIRAITIRFPGYTSGCSTSFGSFPGVCTCQRSSSSLSNLWIARDSPDSWRSAGRGSFSSSSLFQRLRNITRCRAIRPWRFCLAPQWLRNGKWIHRGTRVLGGVSALAALTAIGIAFAVRKLPTPGDISSALSQHPSAYTLSLGHMLDLTFDSFAYLRLPLMRRRGCIFDRSRG